MAVSRRWFLKSAVAAAACTGAEPEDDPLPLVALSKQPWVTFMGDGVARLRFETLEPRALPVTLTGSSGPVQLTPQLSSVQLTYAWGFNETDPDVRLDEPGLHVLQEVWFEGLEPGALYHWGIDVGGGQREEGSFLAQVLPGTPFRMTWVADTMYPNSVETGGLLLETMPDILLHGGDMQYMSNPFDTWMGFSELVLGPVARHAAFATTLGNHEIEEQDELHVMTERLFYPQGDSGAWRYNAWTYGHVRFVHLDTESDEPEATADQLTWLREQLEAVADDPDLAYAVVVMHRPMYTLSKYAKSDTTERDAWHALFLELGVPLVLCGHAHCYERWDVDGITYIVDGGGGALLYDPDEEREMVEALRPGEAELRVAVSRSYGVSVFDFAADGSIAFARWEADSGGDTSDAGVITP